MRTSLNNLSEIEDFLLKRMEPQDRLLFTARLLVDPELRKCTALQQKTYALITLYGRKDLKAEIQKIETKIFNAPTEISFRQKIQRLFS